MTQPVASYEPSRSLPAKLGRRIVQWRHAAPATVESDRPIVSFTFDDFPKSAVTGADIVEKFGGRAGFYASTCYMGATHPEMGEMFDAETLMTLHSRGHEIGAHTHSHIDCARVGVRTVEHDIGQNLVQLVSAGHIPTIASFAYPYGETSFAAKRWSSNVFSTARGVLPGVNVGEVDRAQLRAVELGESPWARKRAIAMIEKAVAANGWLILFSHDVSAAPSSCGVSDAQVAELVQRAVDLGCVLAPPTEAGYMTKVLN
jgi:peptidoglycan/xylan/chitin deacetylase (PgdA/CDA1 family)